MSDSSWFGGPEEGPTASDDAWPAVSEDDAELVDDPGALRRAEEAVASDEDEPPVPWVRAGAEWVAVASAPTGAAWSLEELRDILVAEGIPATYDPRDPREAISLPYGLASEFRVVVPSEHLERARRITGELAAAGSAWSPVVPERRP